MKSFNRSINLNVKQPTVSEDFLDLDVQETEVGYIQNLSIRSLKHDARHLLRKYNLPLPVKRYNKAEIKALEAQLKAEGRLDWPGKEERE